MDTSDQNSVNAEILSDISNYDFKSNNQTDIPVELDWEACLINSKDTTVTLFLHIDDLFRTNGVIYSPNEKDVIKTKNTCYITVTDKNKKTTRIYHPTHPFPISAMWESFMVYDDGKSERSKNLTINYLGRRWPGIRGQLQKSVDALGGGLTKIYCQVVYEERNKVCTFAT